MAILVKLLDDDWRPGNWAHAHHVQVKKGTLSLPHQRGKGNCLCRDSARDRGWEDPVSTSVLPSYFRLWPSTLVGWMGQGGVWLALCTHLLRTAGVTRRDSCEWPAVRSVRTSALQPPRKTAYWRSKVIKTGHNSQVQVRGILRVHNNQRKDMPCTGWQKFHLPSNTKNLQIPQYSSLS